MSWGVMGFALVSFLGLVEGLHSCDPQVWEYFMKKALITKGPVPQNMTPQASKIEL